MANSSRVAEIFQQASVAFGRLAQLTIDLKLAQFQQTDTEQKENVKWTTTEIEQLKEAVARFGNDLGKIAESIETKTLTQIKQKMKSKALQEAGLSDANPPETEQSSEKPAAVTEAPVVTQTTVVPSGRRKQNLEEVSEEQDTPTSKRPRLNDFLDIAAPAEVKQDKPEVERPAPVEYPPSVEVKNDGAFFKRQMRPNQTTLPKSSSASPVPNPSNGSGVLKTAISSRPGILSKPTLRFDPNPTVSKLSEAKYEEYDDSEEGDDADEYEDFDDEDDDGETGNENTRAESEDE